MFENLTLNEKPIKVLSASGYDDGYYWDMNATVEYDGFIYNIIDAGSGSGYITEMHSVIKGDFERLFGEEQKSLDTDNIDDINYFEEAIVTLLGRLFESGAKEKWEYFEDDDNYHTHIKIDGEEIGIEREV